MGKTKRAENCREREKERARLLAFFQRPTQCNARLASRAGAKARTSDCAWGQSLYILYPHNVPHSIVDVRCGMVWCVDVLHANGYAAVYTLILQTNIFGESDNVMWLGCQRAIFVLQFSLLGFVASMRCFGRQKSSCP